MFQYVLFDLDGTLTDPKEGITKSVQFALYQQGIQEPDLDKLEPFIGPPLLDSFMDFYNMTEEEAVIAIGDYRKRFAPIGIFENKLYSGIPELLAHLQKAGILLAVASSKPEPFVQKILKHFSLEAYFDVVVGSELDGRRSSKEEVVEETLRRLDELLNTQVRGAGAMVGDRKFDIEGGKRYGLTAVGVSWGYAGKGELEEAGADYIARSVKQLEKFLLHYQPSAEKEDNTSGMYTDGGPGDISKDSNIFHRSWEILFPFLMYYLGYHACYIVMAWLVWQWYHPGPPMWFQRMGIGIGELGDLTRACSMLAGAAVLIPLFRKEQTYWSGQKKEQTRLSYLSVGLLMGTAAIGLNILFELTGITALSESYAEVAQIQYQTPFLVGLILFGLIAPLAEELLFRALLFRRLQRFLSAISAGIASALLFGVYHGNVVQGLYAALIGLLIALVYGKSGYLRMAVFAHGIANIVVFSLTYDSEIGAAVGTPINCAIFLTISVLSLMRILNNGKTLNKSRGMQVGIFNKEKK